MDAVTDLQTAEAIHEAPANRGLQAISIAKSYDKRVVLTDVSVSVDRGEVVGLVSAYETGIYGMTALRTTSGYEARRKAALAEEFCDPAISPAVAATAAAVRKDHKALRLHR